MYWFFKGCRNMTLDFFFVICVLQTKNMIFFLKKKNRKKKWKNGWYGIAHYSGTWLKKKKKKKLHIFGLKNTNNKKKSDVIFRHPLKNQYKKIKKLMKSRLFLFFCINFLRGVGIWRRIFFLLFVFFRPKIWSLSLVFFFFSQVPL